MGEQNAMKEFNLMSAHTTTADKEKEVEFRRVIRQKYINKAPRDLKGTGEGSVVLEQRTAAANTDEAGTSGGSGGASMNKPFVAERNTLLLLFQVV